MQSIFRAAGAFVIAACAMSRPAWASPPPWPEAGFTYIAKNEKVEQVYTGFAHTFGLEVRMSQEARSAQANVNGKISTATPTEFLNQLGAAYGMSWFYYGGTLYVSRNTERATRAIQPPGMQIGSLKAALTELGLFEPKFGWGEIADRGVALVSGPPAYVDLMVEAVAALPAVTPDLQVEVVRLRHAQVADRTIYFRDKKITVSGVATILRNLVSGENKRGIPSFQFVELAQPLQSVPEAAPAEGDAGHPGYPRSDSGSNQKLTSVIATSAPSWFNAETRPSIQADAATNSVIIKDRPDRIQMYKQVIAILDVPGDQVEIEAVVIDVNSSKISDLGVDWSGSRGQVSGGFGQPLQPPGPTTGTINVNPTAVLSNIGSSLLARLQMLQSDGSARILSRLPLLTMDNIGAVIDTAETFYIQTTTQTGTAATLPQSATTPITVGATLRVTPHIIHDGTKRAVELFVDIEDSGVQDISFSSIPAIRRTQIGTQAVITENQSLLIGGFNSEQTLARKDYVPILGQLPLVGAFFSKTANHEEKRERMFLLTPRIVPSPLRQ